MTLEKINGSLGFTLRQEDSSVLGHYVRALVKDPALSDGRICPGDRIIAVRIQIKSARIIIYLLVEAYSQVSSTKDICSR